MQVQPNIVQNAARKGSRGMTLVEMLVVLAIIGLIVGGVAVVAGNAPFVQTLFVSLIAQ